MAINPEFNLAFYANSQTIFWGTNRLTIINAHFYIQRWLLVINISKHDWYNSSRIIPECDFCVLYKHNFRQNFRINSITISIILKLSTIVIHHVCSIFSLSRFNKSIFISFSYIITLLCVFRSISKIPNLTFSSFLRLRPAFRHAAITILTKSCTVAIYSGIIVAVCRPKRDRRPRLTVALILVLVKNLRMSARIYNAYNRHFCSNLLLCILESIRTGLFTPLIRPLNFVNSVFTKLIAGIISIRVFITLIKRIRSNAPFFLLYRSVLNSISIHICVNRKE